MNQAVRHLRVDPQPVAGPSEPVCFVADSKPGICGLVASVCGELGLRVDQFDRLPALIAGAKRRTPDLVFIEPTIDGRDGEEALDVLANAGLRCPVQVMSGLNQVLTEDIRRHGERRGLTMLPILHKPFRRPAIRHVVQQLGLRRDFLASINVTLTEALARGWIETWYQPKIDLRGRTFAGAEGFVRARHPEHGLLPPDSILTGAAPADLMALTQHMLLNTLREWQSFASLGVPIKFSINVPAVALAKLPLAAIIAEARPRAATWPGLVLEINEDEIVQDLTLARKAAADLRPHGVTLAIDDFGRGYGSLAQLKDTPFAEMKIDRSLIANCDADRMNAGLCETIIELAHRLGAKAVAEGIESAGELKALQRMGCDMGQGYLFARPMPRENFLKLLRERGKGRPGA